MCRCAKGPKVTSCSGSHHADARWKPGGAADTPLFSQWCHFLCGGKSDDTHEHCCVPGPLPLPSQHNEEGQSLTKVLFLLLLSNIYGDACYFWLGLKMYTICLPSVDSCVIIFIKEGIKWVSDFAQPSGVLWISLCSWYERTWLFLCLTFYEIMLCIKQSKASPLISQGKNLTKQIKRVSYWVEEGFIYLVYWGCWPENSAGLNTFLSSSSPEPCIRSTPQADQTRKIWMKIWQQHRALLIWS